MKPRLHASIPIIDSLETRLRGVRYDNERFRVEIERASEEMIRDREDKERALEKVGHLRTMIADRDLMIKSLLHLVNTKDWALGIFADQKNWTAAAQPVWNPKDDKLPTDDIWEFAQEARDQK